jgi:hypothetical protein
MDFRHFDALSRALSGADSRRRILGVLGALPVAGALFRDEADARKRDRNRDRKERDCGEIQPDEQDQVQNE